MNYQIKQTYNCQNGEFEEGFRAKQVNFKVKSILFTSTKITEYSNKISNDIKIYLQPLKYQRTIKPLYAMKKAQHLNAKRSKWNLQLLNWRK